MPNLDFSKDQLLGYNALTKYLTKPYKDMFVLTGYAGTGKTYLISKVVEKLDLNIAYATYTGKASTILRAKFAQSGLSYGYLGTIHSLIYNPKSTSEGKVSFELKPSLDYDVILIDEASMIGTKIFKDLKSFNIPILFVGDKGQLPPVGDNVGLDLSTADINLTTIHRQSKDNKIIQFSSDIRLGKDIPFGQYADNVWKLDKKNPSHAKIINDLIANYDIQNDIVLCGFNSTRVALNKGIRASLGFEGDYPLEGEKVICLKNNKELDIYNGTTGIITAYTPSIETALHIGLDGQESFPVGEFVGNFDTGYASGMCLDNQFLLKTALSKEASYMDYARGEGAYYNLLDFGYSTSVHKLQGGEQKNVIIFEERCSGWEQVKWNYTAVTRAVDNLYFISA